MKIKLDQETHQALKEMNDRLISHGCRRSQDRIIRCKTIVLSQILKWSEQKILNYFGDGPYEISMSQNELKEGVIQTTNIRRY